MAVFEEWLKEEPDHPIAPAHARGVLRPRCPAAGLGRVHRTDVRQFRRQLRFQARQAVVPRARRWSRRCWRTRMPRRRRASTCSMPAAAPGCAGRSSRRMRGGWWASICPRACWLQAEARNVYDELVKCELTAYLRDSTAAFDVIVSADTLVYFGPLEDVVAAVGGRAASRRTADLHRRGIDRRRASRRGTPSARTGATAIRVEYLERVLADANLRPEIVPAELRLEAGDPVAGLVVRATVG